ncbi:hypothetical protein FBD94_23525 [Pedobacter hiemivivus]|uniref:O-antigen ligase domain-containing protein n=1 Tax=Pedobacter hiemivivus TaxID=2530454 RepID=A0A4U1G5Y0_9SPHI|nr:hypothetical protein [Pedobacter hiemivivus]TCC92710.1 hypothetical protein EZ444_18405 [Pedobacter hiemivivus]TKC56222.1 hypothetical protein FBD94_23525 [Pedobacter hiemivivus]
MVHINPAVGSILSYSTFLLIIIYYLSTDHHKPVIPFIVFGLLFSLICLIVSSHFFEMLLVTFMKYFVFIIMVSNLVRDVKNTDIYCLLLIGSLSIIYEAIFVVGIGMGSTGFYLNANFAAYACLLGYIFGLSIENQKLKIAGQILFSIAGLVTFSRTFLLIWLLINLLSVFVHYKNIYKVAMCVALFVVFLVFGDKFDFSSSTETWRYYYDKILSNPIWGNGYHSFSKESLHNTFLMIMGEAGIFALLYFMWMYGYLLVKGVHYFKDNPIIFFLSFSLVLFMLTEHSYFDNYLVLFISLWLYHETYKLRDARRQKEVIFTRSTKKNKESNKENLLKHYSLN